MKSILLIIPYFGTWPIWFEAHLVSIKENPTIDWLVVTDCDIPKLYPSNITFLQITLKELNKKVNKVVEAEVPLNPRKFCDLKPAYGDIFNEYIKDYDFWGICDMDIVWGDIRKFMTPELLNNFDIICSRPEAISGHFSLFRNLKNLNVLYKTIPNYKKLFEVSKFMWFDEEVLTKHIKYLNKKDKNPYKVFWNKELIKEGIESEKHQEYYLDRWLYKDGKVFDLHSDILKEYMYLHFINWKRTMKYCEVEYTDTPEQFYISYTRMHYKPHSHFAKALNRFKNLFDGYWVQQSIRIKKLKARSLSKRVKRKILSTFEKLRNVI